MVTLAEANRYTRIVTVRDSSNISQVSYNPEDSLLLVKFVNGDAYTYQRVSFAEFGSLVSADSVGKAFIRYIRPKQASKVS